MTLRQKNILACIVLACATFVVFSGVLNNDFVGWDDDSYILGNPFITPLNMQNAGRMFSGFYFSSWTPLSLFSHAVDYALWGLDPRGHHLTNVIVHVLNTVWVYLLALQLIVYARRRGNPEISLSPAGGSREPAAVDIGGALIAAAVFSWHPLRVESVACASSRKELLCAFFAFPSVYAYLTYRLREGAPATGLYWISVILFTVALLAKPAIITWPILLVGFEALESTRRRERPRWGRIMLRAAPFVTVSAAAALIAYTASRQPGAVNLLGAPPAPLLPAYTFWFYLQKTLWPAGLSAVYQVPAGSALAAASAAGVLAVFIALLLARSGFPALLVALTVHTVTLLPVLGIVPTTIQAIANRYTYVAAPAAGILLGYLFVKGWERGAERGDISLRRYLLAAGTILVSAGLVVLSERGIRLWRDAETMWRNAALVSPDHPVVRLDLGLTLLDQRAFAESIGQIQQAIALKPDYAEAYSGLGAAYAGSGDTAHAEQALVKSLQLAPDNYLALSRLGYLRIAQHRFNEASQLINAALERAPGDAFSLLCMADLCYKEGDAPGALRFARAAIGIRPTYGEAYYLAAAVLLRRSPRDPEGIAYLRTAASLGFQPAMRQIDAHTVQ